MPALTPEKKDALVAAMKNEGVLYHGLEVLGGGSILGGLILTAIAVGVIDRSFAKAAAFSLAGGVLTFFGLMHGERIGFAMTPVVAVGYLAVAGVFFGCAKLCKLSPAPAPAPEAEPEPTGPGAVIPSTH
jgi:AGZA family xanthine/uracil permease-like MFS transporter